MDGCRHETSPGISTACIVVAATTMVVIGFGAGCTFESELDKLRCDGGASNGRTCENGFYVRVDSGGPVDTTPDRDTLPDPDTQRPDPDTTDTDGGTGCSPIPIWYRDQDGDGYGTPDDTLARCSRPAGYVDNQKDCDDMDPTRHELRPEACNGEDDDCDGQVDEQIEPRSCQNSQGQCKTGQQTCENGSWSECSAEPSTEKCNGKDDDCDGQTDEGLGPKTCGTNTGQCSTGTSRCVSGGWSPCQGNTGPSTEYCNGKDDDCDGTTDNGTCKPIDAKCKNDSECISRVCRKPPNASGSKRCRQVIFVTAITRQGNFGGVGDANRICINRAWQNGLGTMAPWNAILSDDNQSARSRITFHFPIYNRRGQLIADEAEDLWDDSNAPSLHHDIQYDASNQPRRTPVWTGTSADGSSQNYCKMSTSWNSTKNTGTSGNSRATGRRWLDQSTAKSCSRQAAFYCILAK